MRHVPVSAVLVACLAWTAGPSPAPAQTPPHPSLRQRMLAEEDARSPTPTAIVTALKGDDADLRRVAVRALGRFEQPSLMAAIGPSLDDVEPAVRAEAANAVAQSVFAGAQAADVAHAAQLLRARLARESHPLVRGALAAALGRLPYATDEAGRAAAADVLDVAFPREGDAERRAASPAVLLGALRGLHAAALAGRRFGEPRRDEAGAPVTWLSEEAVGLLASLLLTDVPHPAGSRATMAAEPAASRPAPGELARRLAIQALAATRRSYPALGLALIDDPDTQVRAIAVRWAVEAIRDEPARATAVEQWGRIWRTGAEAAARQVDDPIAALQARLGTDEAGLVRFEAIRALVQTGVVEREGCRHLLRALEDRDLNVARYAAVNVTGACRTNAAVRSRLEGLARDADESRQPWHRPAYALLGLAHVAPAAARPMAIRAMASAHPWVRRYAVLAAAPMLAEATAREARDSEMEAQIVRLAGDIDPTVAATALRVLASHRRQDARGPALRALTGTDGDLLLEAVAALLPSGPDAAGAQRVPVIDEEAADACAGALERVTALRRETSRDPRLALIGCVARLGAAVHAARLEPLLTDYDAVVARRAAEAIGALRPDAGVPPARPAPLPLAPPPTDAQIERMEQVRVVLSLRGRGEITLRLLPQEAPLNAWRFLRLAESGYYTGLTFHRIVAGFIVQGGSPAGHEYSGDGPFSRDEVGRQSNLRGSVGLSTRGRDTGDAQFYVNLVDNLRLDHTYTVFARVEAGMDVVDAMTEGDVIERVTVR